MPPARQPNTDIPTLADRILARAGGHEHAAMAELAFLAAWDKGLPASASSILRVRQLRRANQADARAGGEPGGAPPEPKAGMAWET